MSIYNSLDNEVFYPYNASQEDIDQGPKEEDSMITPFSIQGDLMHQSLIISKADSDIIESNSIINNIPSIKENKPEETPPKIYCCDTCHTTYQSSTALSTHARISHTTIVDGKSEVIKTALNLQSILPIFRCQYKFLNNQKVKWSENDIPMMKEMNNAIKQYMEKYLPTNITSKSYFSCEEVICQYIVQLAQSKVEESLCQAIVILLQYREYMMRNATLSYPYSVEYIPLYANGFFRDCKMKLAKNCFIYRNNLFVSDTAILEQIKATLAGFGEYLVEKEFTDYQMISH